MRGKLVKGRRLVIMLSAAMLALACGLVCAGSTAFACTWEKTYPEGPKPGSNPLKGWARWGENLSEDDEDASLAYVAVYWRDIEPTRGCYDFDALEKRWHFEQWAERGVHLILRVVADKPDEEKHMDIPDWLYDAMDGAGTWYDGKYGKGFSPDYEDPVFQAAHERLLKALGRHYDNDPRVAYVQLGSLGHWGEWHVNQDSGIPAFPTTATTDVYIKHYVQAFRNTPLLMRRPFEAVDHYGLGLFNDSFGRESSDRTFAGWIADGYVSGQSGEKLPGCPGFWKKGPSGGEIATSVDMEAFLTDHYDRARACLETFHTTWLGPNSPRESELSEAAWQNAKRMERDMGYCFTLRNANLEAYMGVMRFLTLRFENIGLAPMYADWKLRVELRDKDNNVVAAEDRNAATSSWLNEGVMRLLLPNCSRHQLPLTVWIGFVDPMTDTCRIALANDLPEENGLYCIGAITAGNRLN